MSSKAMDKLMKKFEKLSSTWKDSAESFNNDELKVEILKCQQTVDETEQDMEADEKLQSLKQDVKDLSGGYKDVIKEQKLRVKYCWHLLRSRGNV